MTDYPRLNFGPYWQMNNENLIELIDLVPEEKLDWSPAPTEWSIRVIATHIILARAHHIIAPSQNGAETVEVVMDCKTKDGLKRRMRSSWDMVEAFLADQEKLDAVHEPPKGTTEPEYLDPEVYDGHYVAYHRMAHDLHHRSTIIGHLGQLEISLDGRRVRPL